MRSLHDLYINELKDIYDAENRIIQTLPKMIQAATHEELREAFDEHLRITRKQKERLERIFSDLNEDPNGTECEGMKGLIKEGEKFLNNNIDPNVLDAALISSAQRIEHYEMAAYGTVRTYAEELGREDDADLLQQTLDEEGEADHKLSEIAIDVVNLDAEQ